MTNTVKLYDDDQYLKEFTAYVLAIKDNIVVLDQTAFYAASGGQVGDTGKLNNENVIDTVISDNEIIHIMENPPRFKLSDKVYGKIDWDRRYRIMKLHSASHIMEYFLWKRFGFMKRTGSKVDEKKDRADYMSEERLDQKKLMQVEEDTNQFLAAGHSIIISVNDEGIRNWKCGPVEMHCAGTHVKNTREIGVIKLKRRNPGRDEERVETSLAY